MAERASLFPRTHSLPEVAKLQKLFSTFPDGLPGFGLILLRFAIGLRLAIQGAYTIGTHSGAPIGAWAIGLVAILVGAALVIGFLTPLAGVSSAIINSAIGISLIVGSGAVPHDKAWTEIDLVVISIAVVLLGPGAFSLDAHLFGRREIIIPKDPPLSRP